MSEPIDLDELDRLCREATAGPWEWDKPDNWAGLSARIMVREPYAMIGQVQISGWKPRSIGKKNAAYIVAACNSAPALIAELRAARAEIAQLRIDGRKSCIGTTTIRPTFPIDPNDYE